MQKAKVVHTKERIGGQIEHFSVWVMKELTVSLLENCYLSYSDFKLSINGLFIKFIDLTNKFYHFLLYFKLILNSVVF
jgi:hypothetical protein